MPLRAWGRRAGERYDFATVEGGVRYMLAGDLSQRLYRTSKMSPLRRLLERNGETLLSIRSVGHDGQQTLKQLFDLPSKAAWSAFASWRHFLIACTKSQTPMAREIQAYLMDVERDNRVNAAAEHETGLSARQLARLVADEIERRTTKTPPPPPDVALQDLLARRIANIESLITLRKSLGLRVGSTLNLALEAVAGEVAGRPVTTLSRLSARAVDAVMYGDPHRWATHTRRGRLRGSTGRVPRPGLCDAALSAGAGDRRASGAHGRVAATDEARADSGPQAAPRTAEGDSWERRCGGTPRQRRRALATPPWLEVTTTGFPVRAPQARSACRWT
jgi:hypothetical protein